MLKRGNEAELQSLGAPFTAKLNFFRSAANSYQQRVFQHLVLEGDLVKTMSRPPDFSETIQIIYMPPL